jgi:hypothetical protein
MPVSLKRPPSILIWGAYCCLQTLQFIRFYSVSPLFYLKMHAYLTGQERVPFQERVLPILFMKPLFSSYWVMHSLAHKNGLFTPERGPFYLLSLIAFAIAGIFVQKLYSAVTPYKSLSFMVYPIFLSAAMWSYVIHSEADFSYPYDMPSVAFFAAGLYFIYTRKFLPLLPIMFFGTLNRETTLFLIGIYIIDAATVPTTGPVATFSERFSLAQVPWKRVILLTFVWVAIKVVLGRIFHHNDTSENYVRILENVTRMKPRLWPAVLNICGYLLPIVWLYRKNIAPVRFANYLYIMPLWFAVMFYTGVIVETRIYGELCSFVAVALVLILEKYMSDYAAGLVAPGEINTIPATVQPASQITTPSFASSALRPPSSHGLTS